jgi:hypothetical protein
MKKFTLSFLAAVMLFGFMPAHLQAAAEKGKVAATTVTTVVTAEEMAIVSRLEVIKAMDMSDLSSVQKRELRQEVRSINRTLKEMHGEVIYISAGGLLVVVLLLIILF